MSAWLESWNLLSDSLHSGVAADTIVDSDTALAEIAKAGEVLKVGDARFAYFGSAIKSWVNAWPAQSTMTETLRVSGLANLCPREFVLNYWKPIPNRIFDMQSILRMQMGTDLHAYLQNAVLGPMGILHGGWVKVTPEGDELIAGELVRREHGFHPEPDKALWLINRQEPLEWFFQEQTVYCPELRLRGHLDGAVCLKRIAWLHENARLVKAKPLEAMAKMMAIPFDRAELANLEIKSTNSYSFGKLVMVSDLPSYYKMQASVYQRLTGILKTVFWYVGRDNLDFKFLLYGYEPGYWVEARRKANAVWRAIRDETLPDSMMACTSPKDKRAKECVHAETCWLTKLNFKLFVERQKKVQPDRKWLDMSGFIDYDAA